MLDCEDEELRMISLRKLPIFLATVLATTPAVAAGNSSGFVYAMTVQNGYVIFSITGAHNSNPACSTTSRWSFLANTANGQAMLATLLTAYSTGKILYSAGTGDCSFWPDAEAISYITTQ
jgi:hypothetical protein